VHVLQDVKAHVDTDLVGELERPHREPHVELRRGVDRLYRRVARLDDPRRLVHQGDQNAVDDEPRAVLPDADRGLPHRFCEPLDQFDRLPGGVLPGDDLDEVHPHGRVEKVHSAEALGAVGDLRELGDGEAGGVRDEDGLLGRELDDFLVHVLFDRHLLRDDLHDHVGVGERILEVDERLDAVKRGVGLVIVDPVLFGELTERPLDLVVAVLNELLFDVP